MKKLVILQTATPDYRKKVFQYIQDTIKDSFSLYSGNEYFEDSVKTDPSIEFLNRVKNHFFLRRRFLFQTGMWQESLKSKVLVLEMNPRIISNWLLIIIRSILIKKTVLWGHAWPRKGKNSKSDQLRNIMRTLADEIIVYTKTQAKELQEKMPNKIITPAPNAVFYKSEMAVGQRKINEINDLIYVGRLTKSKKPLFLVQAFIQAIDKLPNDTNLIIVGEGEEKKKIIKLVSDKRLENRIKVLGHIGDYESLKELYATCLFSVSPGYVGLSITQSFGFGVPMLISRNENHSPEIEAVMEGENSMFFDTDDVKELGLKMIDFFENKHYWVNHRDKICETCIVDYSIESMANQFINLAY